MNNNLRLLFFLTYTMCLTSCLDNKTPSDGQKLSGGYVFRYERVAYLLADNAFKPSICGDIKACSFNNDFILIKQKPNKEDYINSISEKLMTYRSLISKDSLNFNLDVSNFYNNIFLTNKALMKVIFVELSPNHNSKDIEKSLIIADSLLVNDVLCKSIFKNKINYWIISHKETNEKDYMPASKIYGPYNLSDYLQMREKIKVPKTLKLNDE